MSVATETPERKVDERVEHRGLTLRSFIVCIVALFTMAIWIEYEELYNNYGGPLSENSPPNSAVGVICILLVISAALYHLRKPLRLVTAELVVIYSALVLAAPLMTQGMWHRFFGLLAGIPHSQDFKTYESLPSMLWPNGPNLCRNGRFEKDLEGFQHTGGGTVTWRELSIKAGEKRKCPVLNNGGDPKARSSLLWVVHRRNKEGQELMVPGESFLFSLLVKTEGFSKNSSYFVKLQADDRPEQTLLIIADHTRPTFALPGGFQRVGIDPLKIPTDLKEALSFSIGLIGDGDLALQDIQFFNVEAVAGAYAGRKVVRASQLGTDRKSTRDFTLVRPDNLLSFQGIKYLVAGYIPLSQWRNPAIAWSLLVGSLFVGFLGLNVLMRKQWVENERFTFPLTILPKNLLPEESSSGAVVRTIVQNRIMWIGLAVALTIALLKGLKYYFPQVPAPVFQVPSFAEYVTSPILKEYLKNVGVSVGSGIGLSLCVMAIALLIETDILFSLWASFLIFQLWFLFGKAFNFNRFLGYP